MADEPKGALPEDFPGRSALEAAGVDTYGKLRRRSLETLTEIEGIGEATASKIREALTGSSSPAAAAAPQGAAATCPECGAAADIYIGDNRAKVGTAVCSLHGRFKL